MLKFAAICSRIRSIVAAVDLLVSRRLGRWRLGRWNIRASLRGRVTTLVTHQIEHCSPIAHKATKDHGSVLHDVPPADRGSDGSRNGRTKRVVA